jgi:hypothetical protein
MINEKLYLIIHLLEEEVVVNMTEMMVVEYMMA